MTTLGLCLLWSAIQATLLAIFAAVLALRPWRLGGSLTPLIGLLATALLTFCSMLPLPGWWPATSLARASNSATPHPDPLIPNAKLDGVVVSQPELAARAVNSAEGRPLLEFASVVAEELKSVRSYEDPRWLESPCPIGS